VDRALWKLIGFRVLAIPVSLAVVATLAFGLVALMPGDPVAQILGQFASEPEIAALRAELGLNLPLVDRYLDFMLRLVHGDLGTSFISRRPITHEIASYLPATIELVALSTLGAVVIGLALGGAGAYFQGRLPGRLPGAIITVIQSVPDFLLALLLIFFFFYLWGLAPPPIGRLGFGQTPPEPITGMLLVDALLRSDLTTFRTVLHASVLPVLTLSVVYSAYIAKIARATISTALASDQVLYARACGLRELRVFQYALLQARTPILTYGAILFGALIGGAAIVETVFAWRGVGEWALQSMLKLDIPAIQGFIIVAGGLTLLIYLALDVLVLVLDPRLRIQ